MGTSVGTKVFLENGWRACAALGVAWTAWQLFIIMIRGPHAPHKRWFGYEGGWEARRSVIKRKQDQELSGLERIEKEQAAVVGYGDERTPSQTTHLEEKV